MNERKTLRLAVLAYWTCFWGLSVVDKVIPDVQFLWVGKDFFALFIKFFASLGLKDPLFATAALAGVSALEAVTFVLFATALVAHLSNDDARSDAWAFRAVISAMSLFALFSIGDQVFGDRFQLLEHGLFWLILAASWIVFKHTPIDPEHPTTSPLKATRGYRPAFLAGLLLTLGTGFSIWQFSADTFAQVEAPVEGLEVAEGVFKFDFPFLADKRVWETTVNTFKAEHPELNVRYIYTGPSELNAKKKTHLLLYVFTEPSR